MNRLLRAVEAFVKALRVPEGMKPLEVDHAAGEWRCGCPPGKPALNFDTSINPPWVSGCARCGRRRPPR